MSFRRADCLVGLGLVAVTAVGLWAFLPSESATRVFGLLDNVVGVESEKIDFPLPAAVAPGTPGMSVAIATYRRAELLKVFIPRYLKEPFINEIVISDDFNSNDAQTLRDWLPTSGISPHDQARVSIYNDTGARLGSFQNKVRAIALAKYSWIALIDSDNFATSAHYWGPLIAFWNATYGSAPPPPGNRTAERRAIHAGAWHKWNDINSPDAHLAFDNMGIATVCTRDGELAPPGSHRDPLASLGAGCWEEAFKGSYLFFNLGNHVMHRATFLPPLQAAADLAAAHPETMDPAAACSIWINYVTASAGLLQQPLPNFYHHHMSGEKTESWWNAHGRESMIFWNAHNLTRTPTKTIGPRHPFE